MPDRLSAVIAVASNRPYLPWVRVFLSSLTRFHPDLPVIVCGVGVTGGDVEALRRIHEPVHLEAIAAAGDGSPNAIVNLRPYWYRDVMRTYRADQYWFMDADLLVRRSLDGLHDLASRADAAIVFRSGAAPEPAPPPPLKLRVAAGLLVVRPSGSRLLDDWIAAMELSGPIEDVEPWDWYWDQVCLYLATRRNGLIYGTIPVAEYLSMYPFDPSAAIWSANGPMQFKDEMRRMFERELSA